MKFSIATITLIGLAPYSSSHGHNAPFLEGESHDAYEERTWRQKLNTEKRDGKTVVVIPAHGLMQCFAAGARYSKKQIPGQGKATWTAKFKSGISIPENPVLEGVDPEQVDSVVISANSDGQRGSGKRVPRRFPIISEWQTTFPLWILDPILIEDVVRDFVELSGLYIGVGRFRPENGGINGRFKLGRMNWEDNRTLVGVAA